MRIRRRFCATVILSLCVAELCGAFIAGRKRILDFNDNTPLLSTATDDIDGQTNASRRRVVIVGGGWAGLSAADALRNNANDDIEIILLDAAPTRGGLAIGWRTRETGKPVEAGLHGFWREYRNTFRILEESIFPEEKDCIEDLILTPWTPSVLVSSSGRVALAPVLGEGITNREKGLQLPSFENSELFSMDKSPSAELLLKTIAPLLPPPLDVALLGKFYPNSPLTGLDRLSGIGLLGAWADFEPESPSSWARYDGLSAETLFREKAGVTQTLYEELVTPLLHVLPMTPGYDCSAAAALSCFHVFALQSRGAFDVRWCRGTLAETIFNPWAARLTAEGKNRVDIRGSSRVSRISVKDRAENESRLYEVDIEGKETIECDALIMAIGGTAMGTLAAKSSPEVFSRRGIDFSKNRGITCVAVRIFLEPHKRNFSLSGGAYSSSQLPEAWAKKMKDSPVVVCGPGLLPELKEIGFCIYDLQRLHDEFANSEDCAVLEIDFYRADGVVDMQDEEIVSIALQAAKVAILGSEQNANDSPRVVDSSVIRARNAVSHFCINSASHSPNVRLSADDHLYMCGDWVERTGHSSWSTEKAVVTGRQAAAALLDDFNMKHAVDVIPGAKDTPILEKLRDVAKFVRMMVLADTTIPPSPWAFAEQMWNRQSK